MVYVSPRGRIIRNGRTSPAGAYKSFCVSLRFCPRLPRRQASDRRLVAGQPHGTLTLAGYSADRAFRLRKYHYPSLTVIAVRGSQSHGRGLSPDLSIRSCRPVACSLLRQRERICLMGYSVVNEQRGILSPHILSPKKRVFYASFDLNLQVRRDFVWFY